VLKQKAEAFDKIVKIGRTHLNDATPIRLGQEFRGFARQIELAIERIQDAAKGLQELALGGTAVGTGINTHPQFGPSNQNHLRRNRSPLSRGRESL
jgi:fumarate hydratase class II